MLNPNKEIHNIDERPKGRKGIAEMLDKMMNTTEDGQRELKKENYQTKTTA